jgi:hypothetical protein
MGGQAAEYSAAQHCDRDQRPATRDDDVADKKRFSLKSANGDGCAGRNS